jgi:hypothetical protein
MRGASVDGRGSGEGVIRGVARMVLIRVCLSIFLHRGRDVIFESSFVIFEHVNDDYKLLIWIYYLYRLLVNADRLRFLLLLLDHLLGVDIRSHRLCLQAYPKTTAQNPN